MTITIGSEYTVLSSVTGYHDLASLGSSGFVALIEQSGANPFYAVAATTSGTAISAGTAENLGTSYTGIHFISGIVPLSSTLALAVYEETGGLRARTLSISGATITQNSEITIGTSASFYGAICQLTSTSALVMYVESGTHYAAVLTVSGTTITANSPTDISSSIAVTTTYNSLTKLSSTSAIVAYGSSNYPTASIFTISGTTVSVGSAAIIDNTKVMGTYSPPYQFNRWVYGIDASTAVFAWTTQYGDEIRACAASISGTTITPGLTVDLDSSGSGRNFARTTVCATSSNRIIVAYENLDTLSAEYLYVRSASLSGTTITDNGDGTLVSSSGYYGVLAPISTGFVLMYRNGSDTVAVAEAGVSPLKLYTGTVSLTERSDMTISAIQRGGLLVRDNGVVVVGSADSADSVVVEQADSSDTYATWTNITDSHPTGRVTSLQEV